MMKVFKHLSIRFIRSLGTGTDLTRNFFLELNFGQQVLQAFMNELFTTFDLASSIDRGREEAKRCILVPFENSLIIDFLTRVLGPAAAGAIRSSGRKK